MNKGQIQLICLRFYNYDDWKGIEERLYENSSMNRFFPVKHFISFDDKNYSDYFNKVPFILSVETSLNSKVCSNFDKNIIVNNEVDVEFEVKNLGEILVEVGNVYSGYFGEFGKENETVKFNFEKGKIKEYNLNGVEEIKEIKKGEKINVKKQIFKSFLIERNLKE